MVGWLAKKEPTMGRLYRSKGNGGDQPETGTIVISTRRFWARPASVSLLAIGRVSPAPVTIMRCCMTPRRSEEHTSELQSLMRNTYAVFCLKNKRKTNIRIRPQ